MRGGARSMHSRWGVALEPRRPSSRPKSMREKRGQKREARAVAATIAHVNVTAHAPCCEHALETTGALQQHSNSWALHTQPQNVRR